MITPGQRCARTLWQSQLLQLRGQRGVSHLEPHTVCVHKRKGREDCAEEDALLELYETAIATLDEQRDPLA